MAVVAEWNERPRKCLLGENLTVEEGYAGETSLGMDSIREKNNWTAGFVAAAGVNVETKKSLTESYGTE